MKQIRKIVLCSSLFLIHPLLNGVVAQEFQIILGKKEIAVNEYFTITLNVKNGNLKSYSGFPDIQGFDKAAMSNQSSMNIVNGQMSQEFKLVQNYIARKEGIYTLKPFQIEANGFKLNGEGATIKVGPAKQTQRQQFYSPFDDIFGRNQQPQEFIDVEDDAFFLVNTDKNEIYIGESLSMNIAFYVSEKNRARMDFFELHEQFPDILKKVKPKNCWEESFEITDVKPQSVSINGKNYAKYTFYEGVFYPLNSDEIKIPKAGLKMIKYKVAKQQSFFGNNLQKDFKTFYSQPKTIKVKELPPHPLKNQVSVGNYKLREFANKDKFNTGESFNYQFQIYGEGNISGIKSVEPVKDDKLQFYSPNEFQDINRSTGRVTGKKVFDFYIIPEEEGEYNLGNYFSWIFFNPTLQKYDTLRAETIISVSGESMKNSAIQSTDWGDFYNLIRISDNTLNPINKDDSLYFWMKIFAFLMLIGTILIYFRKK